MQMSRKTRVRDVAAAVVPAGVSVAIVGVAEGANRSGASEPATPPAPVAVAVSAETRTNLQAAFDAEVNAKERYLAAAKQAETEGYPYVARLFRACARAEEAHAAQHVHAIAWVGGDARAVLQRVALGTTAENLRESIDREELEVDQLYPARLALARADHQPAATRSMNYALAAERDHVRLLTEALETLDRRLDARALHVCPDCGHTVATVDFRKCPNCFGSRHAFVAIK